MVFKRIALFLGFVFWCGCAGKSSFVQQDLWKYAPPTKSQEFHLVLLWKARQQKIHELNLAHPEQFVRILQEECASKGQRMHSYQIIETVEDLYSWISSWKLEGSVLFVEANLNLSESTESWKADLQVHSNYQPFFFDLALKGEPLQVLYTKKLTDNNIPDLKDLITWFHQMESPFYREMSAKIVSQSGAFHRKTTLVSLYEGKNPEMKAVYPVAKSGDWRKAKQLYLHLLQKDSNNPLIYLNLSAASQMLGEWDDALGYYEKFSYVRPQGFVWLFSRLPLENYYIPMLKGLALTFKHAKSKKWYDPNLKLAILLFENYTNNLNDPTQTREALQAEAALWGHRLVPLPDVDDKLRFAGFTDGGQFGATTPQALGKIVGADLLIFGLQESINKSTIKLVHAPSGEILYQNTIRGIGADTIRNDAVTAATEDRDKIRREKIKKYKPVEMEFPEFRKIGFRKFFRSWPHYLSLNSKYMKQ